MADAKKIYAAIQTVKDQKSFIKNLLIDALDWKIPDDVKSIDDISFAWSLAELKADGIEKKIVDGTIYQIQPFEQNQSWGIFLLEFKNDDAFVKGRGLTGPLRKVLRGLVPKARQQSNRPSWTRDNLLFICTHNYEHYRFAYFKAPKESQIAPLTTFGWGPDIPCRTACEFNLPALQWPQDPSDSNKWLKQWHTAFDKEALTKQFFNIFAVLYDKAVEDIAEAPELSGDAGKHAQLLFDRMLFLYFIQKKGWLDQKHNYLYSHFLDCYKKDPKGHSYYSSFLYPLFLALSDANSKLDGLGTVPFLNGGLFEENTKLSQAEQIRRARLHIKNSTFKAIFEDLLERFNFTVTEDTPIDVEVAIDPEMLGKIFESLVLQLEKEPDKDLRRLTGSYYTPRSIVHFMCHQALKEYLVSQFVDKNANNVESAQERIDKLLTLPTADQLNFEQMQLLMELFTEAEAKMLRQAILDCRVCDPAVGSGAFPVGMLHEMVAAVARLDLRLYGHVFLTRRNYDYDLKKQIIESCLYGVDIQEQAVRLCELRLWLSLVVDYQIDTTKPFEKAIRKVPSLPNLSYRIVRGDSLLERLFGHVVQLDTLAKDAKTKQLIESIQADKQAYFGEANTDEKHRLELKILAKQAELAERLIEAKQTAMTGYQTNIFGDSGMSAKDRKAKEIHQQRVAELAKLKTKVTNAKTELERLIRLKGTINRGDIDTLRRQYFHTGEYPTFMWRVDFAEIFAVKGGFDVVIANPPYVSFGLRGNANAKREWADEVRLLYPGSAEYKISLYGLFLDLAVRISAKQGIACYITPDSFLLGRYFSKVRRTLLDNCAIRTILMFEQDFWKSGVVGRPTIIIYQKNGHKTNVSALITENENTLLSHHILNYTYEECYFETIPFNRFRLFFSEVAKRYVEAVETDNIPLKSIARITTGVRSKIGQSEIYDFTKKNANWKKGIISGSQVLPYKVTWEGHYLNIDGNLLFSGGWDASLVEKPKIMIRQTGDTIIAGIDYYNLYHLNNVHTLAPTKNNLSLPYICALLNSRLMNRYYHLISLELGRAMAQTDIETLELLPYRETNQSNIRKIEDLVVSIDNSNAQEQIDKIFMDIYGLTEELVKYLNQNDLYPQP